MKDNFLMRALTLQELGQERRDKVKKELKAKLQEHMDAYNESQRLLKALQEEKEKWEGKMEDVKAKAKISLLRRNPCKNP